MKLENTSADLFLKEKPVKTLITIRRSKNKSYASKISTKVDTTYAHTVKIINQLQEHGLVKTEKQGRKKILRLTSEGQETAEKLGDFVDLCKDLEGEGKDEREGVISEGKSYLNVLDNK